MFKTERYGGAIIFLLFSAAACFGQTARPIFYIRLYNHHNAPRAEIAEMISVATTVLMNSGVEGGWVYCSPLPLDTEAPAVCGAPIREFDLALSILGRPTQNDGIRVQSLGVTKWTREGHAHSDLYYDAVTRLSSYGIVSTGTVLGYAAAHEIGHFLLGAKAHWASGIMKARFEQEDLGDMARGWLHFSGKEDRQLRARVRFLTAQEQVAPLIAESGNGRRSESESTVLGSAGSDIRRQALPVSRGAGSR